MDINESTKGFELTDEVMEKIGRFSRKPLSKDKVYAFPVTLCDNEIDRDGERFSVGSIEKLASLFVGRTGIFDHDPKGRNQTARIFDCKVETDESRLTSYGEKYVSLTAYAYMVRTQANEALIEEIDAGIKKEVSISCSVAKKTCSVCGRDIYKDPCSHIKGRSYSGVKCYVTLEEPTDAYEWSFVAVPAQVNAGVKKTFGGEPEQKAATDAYLEKIKSDYYLLHSAFCKRVEALLEYSGIMRSFIPDIVRQMPVKELIDMERFLKKELTTCERPQTEALRAKNESYKTKN